MFFTLFPEEILIYGRRNTYWYYLRKQWIIFGIFPIFYAKVRIKVTKIELKVTILKLNQQISLQKPMIQKGLEPN